MLDQIKGLHIEPTNMCTLKCPRCSRTTFLEQFKIKNWENQNLNLDHFKKFIDIGLDGLGVGLNGNNGDPIYHPNLLDLVSFLKLKGAKIIIHTNGSYKSVEWWKQLNRLLDHNDIVNFSIDGIPDNFTTYRINADWSSIKNGIEVMVSGSAKIIWKYLVFKYNETSIDTARNLSIELGMNDFVTVNSDRWIENDEFKPSTYVKVNDESDIGMLDNGIHIGGRDKAIAVWKEKTVDLDIKPICKITNSMHFISATGFYMPCCWTGDHRFYYQSEFYKNKDLYDISKTTLSTLLSKTETINFYNNIEEIKPKYCTFNCGKI